MGSLVNYKRRDKFLSFISKNQRNILNDGRHTRTSGTSKSGIDHTKASPLLQPILSLIVTDSPLCRDHCNITVNIQSKNSETQTEITKLNINKANWHLFTSNEAWNEVTNPNLSQPAEALTKDFYKKNQICANSAITCSGVLILLFGKG